MERYGGIDLQGDPDDPISITFYPRHFTFEALREIVRYQIFRKESVKIQLKIDPHQYITINIDKIKKQARQNANLRNVFLDATAGTMYNSLNAAISIDGNKKGVRSF